MTPVRAPRCSALWLLFGAFSQFPAFAGAAPAPLEAFGRTPAVENVVLSPNGEFIAWSDADEKGAIVTLFSVSARADVRKVRVDGEFKLRELHWANDQTLLMTVSRVRSFAGPHEQRYEFFRTLAVDRSGGPMRVLLMNDGAGELVTGSRLIRARLTKPRTIAMATWEYADTSHKEEIGSRLRGGRRDVGWIYSVFAVDLDNGKGKRIAAGTPFTVDWLVDENGKAAARIDWQADQPLFRISVADGQGWREILRLTSGQTLNVYGVTADQTAIIALRVLDDSRRKLWALPIDGSAPKVLIEDPERDVVEVIRDRFTRLPVAVRLSGADSEVRWLDEAARRHQQGLGKTFPGRMIETYGRSQNDRRLLARVSDASHPAIYYLIDFDRKAADIVGEEYPELGTATLGEVRSISYKTRDGYSIPAFLTLPPGTTGRALPLIVLPHGGPEYHDDADFDWWSQFLASRGYAVLRPEFRGSTGYGEAHRAAGVRQWGKLMQDDVTDGVKAMIDQKIADPARICIVGTSYGGYAALAGAAFTPDLYVCAVSVAGVSDLPTMLAEVKEHTGDESNALAYWEEDIGSAFDKDVIDKSPARHVENIRAAILLIHGTDDTVVPISQSLTMARAMLDAGKKVTLVRLPGEDHWLSRSATRVRMLQELDSFLQKNLPANSSPATAAK